MKTHEHQQQPSWYFSDYDLGRTTSFRYNDHLVSNGEFLKHVYKFFGTSLMKQALVSVRNWFLVRRMWWNCCVTPRTGRCSFYLMLSLGKLTQNPAPCCEEGSPGHTELNCPANIPAKILLQQENTGMNKPLDIPVPSFKSSQPTACKKGMSWPRGSGPHCRSVNTINAVLTQWVWKFV